MPYIHIINRLTTFIILIILLVPSSVLSALSPAPAPAPVPALGEAFGNAIGDGLLYRRNSHHDNDNDSHRGGQYREGKPKRYYEKHLGKHHPYIKDNHRAKH
jgi:hypothetical protein